MWTFSVLGPTEAHDGDREVDLGGPTPRRLVTLLVAAEGRPVPDGRLSEAMWPHRPPADPAAAIQVYVSRLRRALGDEDRGMLRRTPNGYQLVTAPGATDVQRFTQQISTGRELAGTGRTDEALRAFDAALRLWRGEPFTDLAADAAASAGRAQLREWKESVEEDRLACQLAAGDAATAIADLEGLVAAAPYREQRWALLVRGLYNCGRQADALATLRRVRALLADDLGVDPGPELQRLEQQVLAQDPGLWLDKREGVRRGFGTNPSVLSRPLSTFLGRDTEAALLAELVAAYRLVTVVGAGGVGKTRLAVEHAATRSDNDGPWLAPLADITDPALLPTTIGAALGLTEVTVATPESLAETLRGRHGLLLLDNCEHLIDEVAALVPTLLSRASGLRVLATSRVPLGTDGERLMPLGPLSTGQASELLIDRIHAIHPAWTPDEQQMRDVEHVVTVLDGVPLALELAAARARVLGVRELARHLDDRFTALGTVPAGSLNSHATLEAAIAWSFDLLPDIERSMLIRLWPFEGGFPLEAATAILPSSTDHHPIDVLSSLISRSMVIADTTSSPSRYRLLESIRAYCRKLDEAPDASRDAQAAWAHDFVSRYAAELRGPRSAHAMRMLTRDLPNIRAAIHHDLGTAPEVALRTTAVLMWFWIRNGTLIEGQRLLRACLDAAPDAPVTDIARAEAAYAGIEYGIGDTGRARDLVAGAALALRTSTDRDGQPLFAEVRYYQALLQVPDGDADLALAAATEACRIGAEIGLDWLVASAQMTQGAALLMAGRTADARATLRSAIRAALACGMKWTAAAGEFMLARHLLESGEPALHHLRNALRLFQDEDDLSNMLLVLHHGAQALTATGQSERASRLRLAAHHHLLRHGLRSEQTYAASADESWDSTVVRDEDPPDLPTLIALFQSDL